MMEGGTIIIWIEGGRDQRDAEHFSNLIVVGNEHHSVVCGGVGVGGVSLASLRAIESEE